MGTFSEDLQVFVDALGPAGAEMLKQASVDEKAKVETEQASRRGIEPLTHIAVDGQSDDDLSGVKATSVVFEYWDYRAEIVKACFEECQARAPTGPTGHYRDGFVALLDGRGLDALEVPAQAALDAIQRVTVTNAVPYARRLEVGLDKAGAPFVKQVDPHIMESAMVAVRREFNVVAKISFGYVDLESAYIRKTNLDRSGRRRTRKHVGTSVKYPAIFIDQA